MSVEKFEMPRWMKGCPLSMDWCTYRGEIYFAVLNYEESEKKQKPVFDLAYCATKGLNGIFLKRIIYGKSKLKPYSFNTKETI